MLEIHSKDTSMYDYAEDYYKLEAYIEKIEKRKLTPEEKLIVFAILANEDTDSSQLGG